ncbi:WbqC family protein [Aurantimonas sp. C2-3-R2]|nr:WbqC family protein [Aurantimonas sp. C2-3-R2]
MRKKIVIIQSNYLPWRGYFDLLRQADQVILFDSVQYTRRDWRNRNKIKTAEGATWLTIPVETKGKYLEAIDHIRVSDANWSDKHRRTIEMAYRRAPGFDDAAPWLFDALREAGSMSFLSAINEHLLRAIMERLGIKTALSRCTKFLDRAQMSEMSPTDRLIALCAAAGATEYLSGPAARSYLDEAKFHEANIAVNWMDYEGYPAYPQLWGEFQPFLSIVDIVARIGAGQAGHDRREQPVAIG